MRAFLPCLRAVVVTALLFTAPAVTYAKRLPLRQFTTTEGLAHNRVNAILRDSHGFLWFATPQGLSRFDGHDFVNYGVEQGLRPGTAEDLVEDAQGFYWVATWGGGVYRFDPHAADPERRFVQFRVGEESRADRVHVVRQDSAGRLWLGTLDGMFVADIADALPEFRRVDLSGGGAHPANPRVTAILEDSRGVLWVGSPQGLLRLGPDGQVVRRPLSQDGEDFLVYGLLEDRDGR